MLRVTERTADVFLDKKGEVGDVIVLHINHPMKNSFTFNEQIRRVYKRIVFVAVPYSGRVPEQVYPYPVYYAEKETEDYGTALRDVITQVIEAEIIPEVRAGRRLLIIEDGGHHYPVLEEEYRKFPELKSAVIGSVEQTMSGTRRALEYHSYPVLSAARSLYKMRFEAKFIAMRIVEELSGIMMGMDSFLPFHDIVVLGYGIIGRNVARCLSHMECRVRVYDRNEKCMAAAEQDGFGITGPAYDFSERMLIIGASGKPSFTREMLERFRAGNHTSRLYLVSASTGQCEFASVMEDLGRLSKRSVGNGTIYELPEGKEVMLMADGYPVNLWFKEKESLNDAMIDPVFAEMLQLSFCLYEHGDLFCPETYLLGGDERLDHLVNEDEILQQWKFCHSLCLTDMECNVHPMEQELRKTEVAYEL